MKRYQRQMLLPEIGESGQQTLLSSKVLIVGAGGLGHPVLQYLVAMGVGQIGIMDGDLVDESNLHRQVLFSARDIGKNKADCLKDHFSCRDEVAKIISYPYFANKKTALEVFPDYDLIVDGTDNFQAKFLINDVCCFLKIPMAFGSISQFEGQASVFWRGHGPCYRCLVPEIPKARIQSCAEAGVVGALPGAIGCTQSLEVLKVLLNMKTEGRKLPTLSGRLQVFDFLEGSARTLTVPIRPSCRCQKSAFTVSDISEEDVGHEACSMGGEIQGLLLDVREPEEWDAFHVDGSLHWPLSRMEVCELPKHLLNKKLTAVCVSGSRAARAAEILNEHGFAIGFTKRSIYGFENWNQQKAATDANGI